MRTSFMHDPKAKYQYFTWSMSIFVLACAAFPTNQCTQLKSGRRRWSGWQRVRAISGCMKHSPAQMTPSSACGFSAIGTSVQPCGGEKRGILFKGNPFVGVLYSTCILQPCVLPFEFCIRIDLLNVDAYLSVLNGCSKS